ncbi:MAG TPA: glycosyltransferase [Rhodanobacteraceae bacterium]
MAHTVLMVAFHFPPAAMGSGHLRTLGFAKYLPESGWEPVVLSARALAYPRTLPMAADTIPPGCVVKRALAFDAGRHFAIAGKYPGFIARPDRWASWWPAAVWQGLRLIRRRRVSAIWSTYPIMTAHHIAHTLARISGLPWIADFRDPVSGSIGGGNPYAAASQRRWEQRVVRDAARVVFTTPSALRDCVVNYPIVDAQGRLSVIGNGYDEAAFADLPQPLPRTAGRPLLLVHSGLLYRDGRDPLPFFNALATLRDAGTISAASVRIVLRASGSESIFAQVLQQLRLADIVTLAPPVGNRDALVEQACADGLLLFQGARFNRQIPAKLYEYLRIGRPIFALVDARGDTAAALRGAGVPDGVAIDSADAIALRLSRFIDALRCGNAQVATQNVVARYARSAGAAQLAGLLDQLAVTRPITAASALPPTENACRSSQG